MWDVFASFDPGKAGDLLEKAGWQEIFLIQHRMTQMLYLTK
jgi:ABC-type transport system substrate-binding protein